MTLIVGTFDYSNIDTNNVNISHLFSHVKPVWFVDNKILYGHSINQPTIEYRHIPKLICTDNTYIAMCCNDAKCVNVVSTLMNTIFDPSNCDTNIEKSFIPLTVSFIDNYNKLLELKLINDNTAVSGFVYALGVVFYFKLRHYIKNSVFRIVDPTGFVELPVTTDGVYNVIVERLNHLRIKLLNADEPTKFIDTVTSLVCDELRINTHAGFPMYKIVFPSYREYSESAGDAIINVTKFELVNNVPTITDSFVLERTNCGTNTYTGFSLSN